MYQAKKIYIFFALFLGCYQATINAKPASDEPTNLHTPHPSVINKETIMNLFESGNTDLLKKYPTFWAYEYAHIKQQKNSRSKSAQKTSPAR